MTSFELPTYPNFLELEKQVQEYWKLNDVMDKYLKLNQGSNEQFSFFDGPITANNPMGVHHAWGRTIKDSILRYQTFLGKKLRYQNGFDCQGLWIEVEVEKNLKLNSKKEILNFGLENFSKACQDRIQKYGSLITDQSKQLGQFMSWNDSYWTHSDNNIEHIWYFLGKCYENGWLYKGHKIMPWCTRCETSLSQHEQTDSYQEIVHPSIFVQFKLVKASNKLKKVVKDRSVHFLVWTTTPWTLPSNTAVAVHPDLTYVVVQDDKGVNTFIVSEKAFAKLKFLRKFSKLATLLGNDLVSSKLESLTKSFVPVQLNLKIQVVSADFVSEDDGTGLVHIAPGCGLDDYELGKKFGLAFLNPLHEDGTFVEGFGFDGVSHLEVSKLVQEKLSELGLLFKRSSLKHRYPVCWRCGHELTFRLVNEWFIRTDEIRPKLLSAVETVSWHPYYMKEQMKNWLKNMDDWCISRNRFWGLPLPFFECSCGHLTVVARLQELYSLAGFSSEKEFRKVVPDLHRPYVDDLEITCPNCSNKVKRVLSVGDCWLDAGVIPFSTLNYLKNHNKNSFWEKWFPANFVVEMREQIRLWFYSLLFMSVTLTDKAPYKTVMAYEKVLDENGEAMHRSRGNAIWWSETAEKAGSDANRLFYTSWDPTKPLLYGYNNLKKSLNDFNTFWSCCRFFQQNISLSKKYWNELAAELNDLSVVSHIDLWLLFDLQETDKIVHKYYNEYKLDAVRTVVDNFWQKLSTFWLRNRRTSFWEYETAPEKTSTLLVYQLLWQSIQYTLFWLAPIAPHVSEYLFQTLVRPYTNKFGSSIHLSSFPSLTVENKPEFKTIKAEVLEVDKFLEVGRNLRQQVKVKGRYVLPMMYVTSSDATTLEMLEKHWKDVLQRELNVENLLFSKLPLTHSKNVESLTKFDYEFKISLENTKNLKIKWIQSDLIRTMQFLRKKANLGINELAQVLLKYDKQNLAINFLTNDFLKKLESDVYVTLLENMKNENLANEIHWHSKTVDFDDKIVTVYLSEVD